MRLFIATSFPKEVIGDLNARVASVKSKLAAASWVRPETQHLTFAFLGEQEEAMISPVSAAVKRSLTGVKPFEARLRGAGFFPNSRRARVGWVGLDPEKSFIDIASVVRTAVTGAGIELDRADFKPHLTIMRLRDPWPQACIQIFERTLGKYESQPFTVSSLTLYSSKLNPGGAVHTPILHFGF